VRSKNTSSWLFYPGEEEALAARGEILLEELLCVRRRRQQRTLFNYKENVSVCEFLPCSEYDVYHKKRKESSFTHTENCTPLDLESSNKNTDHSHKADYHSELYPNNSMMLIGGEFYEDYFGMPSHLSATKTPLVSLSSINTATPSTGETSSGLSPTKGA